MKTLPRLLLVAASVPGITHAVEPHLPQGVIPESALAEIQKAQATAPAHGVPIAAIEKRKSKVRDKLKDCEKALKDSRASVTPEMEEEYSKMEASLKQSAMRAEPIGFVAPGMLTPERDSKH